MFVVPEDASDEDALGSRLIAIQRSRPSRQTLPYVQDVQSIKENEQGQGYAHKGLSEAMSTEIHGCALSTPGRAVQLSNGPFAIRD